MHAFTESMEIPSRMANVNFLLVQPGILFTPMLVTPEDRTQRPVSHPLELLQYFLSYCQSWFRPSAQHRIAVEPLHH